MIIADSDVLIDALRGKDPMMELVRELLVRESLLSTAISVFELQSGARTEKEEQKVRTLFTPMRILDLSEETASKAAQVRKNLERSGQPIGMGDSLIAGICLHYQLPLLTRNRKHFERVDTLRLVDIPSTAKTKKR